MKWELQSCLIDSTSTVVSNDSRPRLITSQTGWVYLSSSTGNALWWPSCIMKFLSLLSLISHAMGRRVVEAHTRNDISGHVQCLELVFFQFPWEALLWTILLPSFPWVVLPWCFAYRADFCVIKPWVIVLPCFLPSFFSFPFLFFSPILWLLALIVNLIQSSLQTGEKSLS